MLTLISSSRLEFPETVGGSPLGRGIGPVRMEDLYFVSFGLLVAPERVNFLIWPKRQIAQLLKKKGETETQLDPSAGKIRSP